MKTWKKIDVMADTAKMKRRWRRAFAAGFRGGLLTLLPIAALLLILFFLKS